MAIREIKHPVFETVDGKLFTDRHLAEIHDLKLQLQDLHEKLVTARQMAEHFRSALADEHQITGAVSQGGYLLPWD